MLPLFGNLKNGSGRVSNSSGGKSGAERFSQTEVESALVAVKMLFAI